jgi:Domain of unknown function (DUF5615)
MSNPRFLVDADTPTFLASALRQAAPNLDVWQSGDPGAPPRGTLDPELLIAAEALGRVLISKDRKTMPSHLTDHFVAGRHTAGVMLLRNNFTLAVYLQKIVNLWATTTADSWVDRIVYIP